MVTVDLVAGRIALAEALGDVEPPDFGAVSGPGLGGQQQQREAAGGQGAQQRGQAGAPPGHGGAGPARGERRVGRARGPALAH